MTVRGVEAGPGYGATLGPLFLMLLPALLVGWRGRSVEARRRLALLLVIAGIAYVAWLAQLAWSALLLQSRLLLGVFPLLACLAAAGFDGLVGAQLAAIRTRWVIGGAVAVVLFLNAAETAQSALSDNPMPVLAGVQSQEDYLREKLGWYAVAIEQVNALPAASQVLFLWEPRSYHCQVTCFPDAILDRWWHLRRSVVEANAIATQWRVEGVTHVLVFEAGREAVQAEGFDPLTEDDWAALQSLQGEELRFVQDFGGAYQLYELAHSD